MNTAKLTDYEIRACLRCHCRFWSRLRRQSRQTNCPANRDLSQQGLATYLDSEPIALHCGVNQEEHGLGQQTLVLRVLQQRSVVLIELQSGLIDGRPGLVEADEALLRVHLSVEFQHFLCEFIVCHDVAIGTERDGAREARHDVDFAPIDAAEERADHSGLVLGPPQVMV